MADIFPGATAQQVGGFFPRAGIDPNLVYSVVHITAGLGDGLAIAESVAGNEVTATFWVNRDGKTMYQTMLDPVRQGPWTNGVLNGPDLTNRRIARMVADKVNANTRNLVTIENVGLEPGSPITAAQEAAAARIIAHYHRKFGVPITRETVVGHYQFNRVIRANCPSTNKAILDRIVALAQGGDMPLLLKNFVAVHNRKVTLIEGTSLWSEPDVSKPAIFTYKAGTPFFPDFRGQGVPVNGTDQWYAGWGGAPAGQPFSIRTGYIHTSNTSAEVPIEAVGLTQEDVDAAAKAAADAVANAADTKAAEF